MITPVVQQKSFRSRTDTVGLNVNTWTNALNTNWTQITDQVFRVRFTIQETAGAAITQAYQLRYSKNGGAYTAITASSSNVKLALSGQFADLDAATQVLASGTGSYVNGQGIESSSATGSIAILASGNTEIEFSLSIVGLDVANSDTLDFRVYTSAGVAIDTYTVTPRATASRTISTQTITGKGRITATTSQTITGKAAVQNTTTKTVTGVARVQATTSKVITGVAKIVPPIYPVMLENYKRISVGDGMSTSIGGVN